MRAAWASQHTDCKPTSIVANDNFTFMIRLCQLSFALSTNPPTSWLGTVTYTTMAPVSEPLPLLLPPASAAMAAGIEMPLWVAQR